jgi:hypothetical protein
MGWVVNATTRPLCLRERPGIYCIESRWPQAWSRRVWKTSHKPGLDPRTVLPVASCYTDCAILGHLLYHCSPVRLSLASLTLDAHSILSNVFILQLFSPIFLVQFSFVHPP